MDNFEISFWNEKVENKDACIIINGYCYTIGSREDVKGYNGREFIIQKINGQVIRTSNLFCNGKIPESYRNMLIDNAKFIKR